MIQRGWTTEDVVRHMNTGRDPAMDLFCLDLLMCVQDDRILINSVTFDGLTRAFGVDPDFFPKHGCGVAPRSEGSAPAI